MEYRQSMNLISPSGYAMPFELPETCPLEITLNYGKQQHPQTGKEFFHHGVDFKVAPHTWLKALATGVVSGIASDRQKGFNITVNYRNYGTGDSSNYDVIYSHIKESVCNFGKNVKAGDNIAVCDGTLHIEVHYNGEDGFTGKNTCEQVKDTASGLLSDIKGTANETKGLLGTLGDTLHGISSFLGNLFGGNGTNMFGNFFNNLASGKISGLGIGGLIAAAYMIFGRTGLLGKIGGALMAMMMIGNNSYSRSQNHEVSESQGLSEERQRNMRR